MKSIHSITISRGVPLLDLCVFKSHFEALRLNSLWKKVPETGEQRCFSGYIYTHTLSFGYHEALIWICIYLWFMSFAVISSSPEIAWHFSPRREHQQRSKSTSPSVASPRRCDSACPNFAGKLRLVCCGSGSIGSRKESHHPHDPNTKHPLSMVPIVWKFPTKNHGFLRVCLVLEGKGSSFDSEFFKRMDEDPEIYFISKMSQDSDSPQRRMRSM